MIIFYYILTLRFSYDLEFIFHLSAIQIPDSSGGICLLPLLLLSLQKMRIKYGIGVDKYGNMNSFISKARLALEADCQPPLRGARALEEEVAQVRSRAR